MNSFFNRELSWIEFNRRVMSEAFRPELPLLERFKFLSITSSNFDEFFMVRVAGIKRKAIKERPYNCPSGISANELIEQLSHSAHQLLNKQYKLLNHKILPALKKEGLQFCQFQDLNNKELEKLRHIFINEIFPVLTPLKAVSSKTTLNFANLELYTAFLLEDNNRETHLAVVPMPSSLKRLCLVEQNSDSSKYILLEELIKIFAPQLFPGYKILEKSSFRITKDMDLAVDEDDDKDFLRAMRQVLIHREKSFPVRLEINRESENIRTKLVELLELAPHEVYDVDGILDLKSLFDLCFIPGFEKQKLKPWANKRAQDLVDSTDIFKSIRQKDILLHHPYEKFDPIIEMLDKAATDPQVLSIKMTLYRTSGASSPIVNSLLKAVANKKQVSVLVELKARFDEDQNILWAQKLEEVGATVIYGVAELKVHCKFLMIIRREEDAVRRYVHLGTGNYNEKTAGIYGDLGLLTCRDDVTFEACLFFNAITGYSIIPNLSYLTMAPTMLKERLLSLIEREIKISMEGGSGHIIAKTNAISDPEIIKAFYRASQAGVKIQLNVRGICMLIPGKKGLSENIEVISIIGRYLEHSRIYYFGNNGNEEIFLASADLMSRNLEKRVELMFPVLSREHKERIKGILEIYFEDNQQSHKLLCSGEYQKITCENKETLSSQALFHQQAKQIAGEKGELRVLKS